MLNRIINTKSIKIYIACIFVWSLLGLMNFYKVFILRNYFIFMSSLCATFLFRMRKVTRELNGPGKTRVYMILVFIGISSTIIFTMTLYS